MYCVPRKSQSGVGTKPQARTTTTTTTLFVPYIDFHDTKKDYFKTSREYRLPIKTIED